MNTSVPEPFGRDSDKRRKNYRELFKHYFSDTVLEQIRKATNKDMIVGNDRFREEIEALTGRRSGLRKRKKEGRLDGGSQRFSFALTPIKRKKKL